MSSPGHNAAISVHIQYSHQRTGPESQSLTTIKREQKWISSLLKAKIKLVVKVCPIVNIWIRKYAISPNQPFLIAQRKDNRAQTMHPPVPLSPAAACILNHVPVRADWQRKTKSALSK